MSKEAEEQLEVCISPLPRNHSNIIPIETLYHSNIVVIVTQVLV